MMTADEDSNSAITTSPWWHVLQHHPGRDLVTLAQEQHLYYGRNRIQLHWLDQLCLRLSLQAYLHRRPLAIVYPVPICHLAALVAAELLIYDFAERHQSTLFHRSRPSFMLISSRTEIREHYLNIRVDKEPLAATFPLARIRNDGEPAGIVAPGIEARYPPRLYHLPRPFLIEKPWPTGIKAIIVDHTDDTFIDQVSRIHELAAHRKISCIIHICNNPFAPYLQDLAEAGVPVWAWSHSELEAEALQSSPGAAAGPGHPFEISARQLNNIASGIRHQLVLCHHPRLENAASRLWDDLGTIQRTDPWRSDSGVRRAIQAAYGVFYTMLQLLVPLPVYEEEASRFWGLRPIDRRIADLEAFTPLLRTEAPEIENIYWPSLLLDLKDMRLALLEGNPKYDTLVQQIREQRQQSGQSGCLAVVCPNQASLRMVQLCLRARERLPLERPDKAQAEAPIRLLTYKDLSTLSSADILLFPGQFSYGRRQYALTAAAPDIRYLAYRDEAERIEQQLLSLHQTLGRLASEEAHQRAWEALVSGGASQVQAASRQRHPPIVIEFARREGSRQTRRKVAALSGFSDLSIWTPFSTLEYDQQNEGDPGTDDRDSDHPPVSSAVFPQQPSEKSLVPAFRVNFQDGFCYATRESRLMVFLSATEQIDERVVEGLRAGDLVLFVDGQQRRTLYEAILERVKRHPKMGATYLLVRYWQESVRAGFLQAQLTYEELLKELQQRGSHMQSVAGVRCWITGQVLGPSDPEDIYRIGYIFEDNALIQEYRNIDSALRRIRSLHRALARQLNRVIIQAGVRGTHSDAAEECIDQELNLYVDDFRDSVTIHRVVSVSQRELLVPPALTQRFFKEGTVLTW
ncbi:DrmE family protein [Thermogemmatispora onikobensis]|uniref:DrmE family protein n=1 Tax=Thermogemmatispora onikobensis TaxID=732234 RepID=UPI00114CC7DC|nr:DrmE family protein [Thermogemmatispora onikobensis]